MAGTRLACLVALMLFVIPVATCVRAEPVYPSRPVRMIVPFAPGGAATSWGAYWRSR